MTELKIINDSTIVVGEYENQSAGYPGNYDLCNQVANQLTNETNGDGKSFNVIRMPMPPYSNGITYTYVNSLIVNNKVLVPIYGFTDSFANDTDVLSQYEDIIPGSEAIGFDCNQIIPANGAIHCIAMKVPAMKEMISCGNNIGDVNLDQRINIFDILLPPFYPWEFFLILLYFFVNQILFVFLNHNIFSRYRLNYFFPRTTFFHLTALLK